MAQTLRDFVLDTLGDPAVDDLNFQFGRHRIYPSGYRRDVAGAIRSGRIELTSDASRVYAPGVAPANASFVTDTEPGRVHPFFVNPRWTTTRSGVLYVNRLSAREGADLRGTIVHECTHALQDYQRYPGSGSGALSPRTAEGAAYLAGAITRLRHGYTMLGPVPNPRVSGIAFSLHLAERFLAMDRHARYLIATADVAALESLVSTGAHHRYVFNGL